MKKTDLAYIAGIIDGEGCIHIQQRSGKNGYQLLLNVPSTDEWLPAWLNFAFGGSVFFRKSCLPNRQDVWVWQTSSNQAKACLEAIYPYLRLKQPQAKIAIEFQQNRRRGGYKTTEEKLIAEAQYILVKKLKHKKVV